MNFRGIGKKIIIELSFLDLFAGQKCWHFD